MISTKKNNNTDSRPKSINTSLNKFKKTLSRPWEELGFDTKRALIIVEQKNKCNRCGLSTWHNEIIILEIDHKDGDRKNNSRENLEGLCPNCHSFTPTWRGRKSTESIRTKRIQEKIKLINILQQP